MFAGTKWHNASEHLTRGHNDDSQIEFEKARDDYREILRITPNDLGAWYGLAVALYQLSWFESAFKDELLDQANDALKRALEGDPDYYAAVYTSGLVKLERWRYAHAETKNECARKAAQHFENAAALKPDSPEPWCSKGMALRNLAEGLQDEPDEGRAHLQEALAAFETSTSLGEVPNVHEEWADALIVGIFLLAFPDPNALAAKSDELFAEAERRGQFDATAYWKWAFVVDYLGRSTRDALDRASRDRVIRLLDAALAIDPQHRLSRKLRGEILGEDAP